MRLYHRVSKNKEVNGYGRTGGKDQYSVDFTKPFRLSISGTVKAIIAGTGLMGSHLFEGWSPSHRETAYGTVSVLSRPGWIFIQRHGAPAKPPHRINHHANISLLEQERVTEVVALCSVGSLRHSIAPGTLVIPDDFIAPWEIPTFFDEEMRFTVPEMVPSLRERLFSLAQRLGLTVTMGGIYVQTRGPRFETRAEIAMLKVFGHIVGMTMASEATLCMELSIPYAALCSVDNFCNGMTPEPLTLDQVEENAAANRAAIENLIRAMLDEEGP
jgi:purine nucleoside phosphorylase